MFTIWIQGFPGYKIYLFTAQNVPGRGWFEAWKFSAPKSSHVLRQLSWKILHKGITRLDLNLLISD